MLKKVLITILILVACSASAFVLVGCMPKKDVELTMDEIIANTKEEFFNQDGTWKKEVWEYRQAMNPNREIPDEITGFEVQFLKDEKGKETWYLVEFEPEGNIVGARNQKWRSIYSSTSVYKYLNIPKNERYVIDVASGPTIYCTMYNGYLIKLRYESLLKKGITEYNGNDIASYTEYFNYDTYHFEWILRSELEKEGGRTNES